MELKPATKEDLIAYLRDAKGLKKKDAENAVDGILSEITNYFLEGRPVRLSRFGIFRVIRAEAREMFIPLKGNVTVPAHRVIRFYPSQMLKNRINPKED